MEKIRFVEYIKQQIEAGKVDAAEVQRWYNEGAYYYGDKFRVVIKTKWFGLKRIVKLQRYDTPYYITLKYTPEEEQMLVELLPKAVEACKINSERRAEQYRKELEAMEWWP